jgi:hypothetical protein
MAVLLRIGAVLVACASVSSCGYTLAGRGNALPDWIKRIGVPMLLNQSTTPEIDQILTEAIRQELRSKGRYMVVADSTGVDAVLTGAIRPIRTDAMGLTEARQAARYNVTVMASIEFKELKTNTVIWTDPTARYSEEYDLPSGATGTDPTLVFQADRQALERLARAFARRIIASIFEAM